MATKKRYKDYAEYLKSPKWKQVKADYADNEETDTCLCCSVPFKAIDTVANYHHFRYPKDWNDDTWINLIVVCQSCHEELHENIVHDSDPISLRSYMVSVAHTKECTNDYQSRLEFLLDSMWCSVRGEFTIIQKGLSRRKQIQINAVIDDMELVEFFEKKRDAEHGKK